MGERTSTRRAATFLVAAAVAGSVVVGLGGAGAGADKRIGIDDPMLVGAALRPHDGRESVAEELEFLEGEVGTLEIRRVFDPDFNRDFMNLGGLDVGRRATHYSFKPDMAALAAGRLDDDVQRLLDSIPAGHRTFLTVWHEPENDFTTAVQKQTYRDGWRRFASLVERQQRPELSTSWVMMAYSFRAEAGRQPLDWWPGDGVVDVMGIDTYNDGSLDGSDWKSPGRDFGEPFPGDIAQPGGYVDGGILAFADRHDIRIGVAEFGTLENTARISADWTDTATKAAWIRAAVDYYHRIDAVYVEYFHAGPHRGPWWLDSSQAALDAYAEVLLRY